MSRSILTTRCCSSVCLNGKKKKGIAALPSNSIQLRIFEKKTQITRCPGFASYPGFSQVLIVGFQVVCLYVTLWILRYPGLQDSKVCRSPRYPHVQVSSPLSPRCTNPGTPLQSFERSNRRAQCMNQFESRSPIPWCLGFSKYLRFSHALPSHWSFPQVLRCLGSLLNPVYQSSNPASSTTRVHHSRA